MRCELDLGGKKIDTRMQTDFEGEERGRVVSGGELCSRENGFVICLGWERRECVQTLME